MPKTGLFNPVEFGQTIKFLRERRGWSQQKLGKLWGEVLGGIPKDQPRVSAAESGQRPVRDLENLLALCEVFQVPPDYFFGPRFERFRTDDELIRLLETASKEQRDAIKLLLAP